MSRWRRFHYSASLAGIVAALSALYADAGGLLVLLPGIVAHLFLEVFLSLLLTDGDLYALPVYAAPVLAAGFYFALFYFVLLVWVRLREI